MISALTNLKKAIVVYGSLHQENDSEQQLLDALINFEMDALFHSDLVNTTEQTFQTFYSELRSTFNIVYHLKNQQVDAVILQFQNVLECFEDLFRNKMDLNGLVSDYEYHLFKIELIGKFPNIKESLYKKKVPYLLIFEVQTAINNQFKSHNSNLHYHQNLFFKTLLDKLQCIAEDTISKNWLQCFMETMIDINFNHMGFFNRCCDIIDCKLKNMSMTEQMNEMIMILFRLRIASYDPKLYYDPVNERLPILLTQYVERRKQILTKYPNRIVDNMAEDSDEPTTVNRNNIITLFHYINKVNLQLEKNSRIDSLSFLKTIIAIFGPNFTEENLLEPDNYLDETDLIKQMNVIIAEIDKDLEKPSSVPKTKR
ncbi:hypothetical protein [Sphingobacterium sp. UDSM-2020]|uniref:hypothetical protein n=1 Tax=Sphingobacterium sp. UDSM-2020 TaxID=2795738 RepID=UPI001935A6EA|nr:hypothetical protein [Sphingobacterium sp. UDSM-2020]QQD16183.1 hypothetical protein JAZ75_11955 [Sphingobacterium sp. UDSM-2020]